MKKGVIIVVIALILVIALGIAGIFTYNYFNSPEKAAINVVKAYLENDGEKIVEFYPEFSVESICKFYQVETKEELAKIVEQKASYPDAEYEIISAERVEKLSSHDEYTFETAFFTGFKDKMEGKELAYVIVKARVNGEEENVKVAVIKCDSKWCCMGLIWN